MIIAITASDCGGMVQFDATRMTFVGNLFGTRGSTTRSSQIDKVLWAKSMQACVCCINCKPRINVKFRLLTTANFCGIFRP